MTIEFPPPCTSKAELLARVDAYWRALEDVVASLDDQGLSRVLEVWSVKDHLAHLLTWEGVVPAVMEGRLGHDETVGIDLPPYTRDFETPNARIYEAWRGRAAREVVGAWRGRHEETVRAIEATPESRLLESYSDAETPAGMRVIDIVAANTYEHCIEHVTWIREQMQRVKAR